MHLLIRPYADADLDAVASLWFESWNSTGPIYADSETTLQHLRARLPQDIAGGWSVHVATQGSEIVGFLALDDAKIAQIFVLPRSQNRGIGKRLFDFAKEKYPAGFSLTTQLENTGAQRFYEREGLKRGETFPHPRSGRLIVHYDWKPE